MFMPRKIYSSFGLLPLIALLAQPAMAQIRSEPPLAVADQTLVLTTLNQRLVLPAPDWSGDVQGDALLASFEAVFRTSEQGADLELYRNGTVYALATEVYGAHIVRDPNAAPERYRDTILDGFRRSCVTSQLAFVQLGEPVGDAPAPLLLVCGAQRDDIKQGEIMALNLRTTSAGIAVVYQQWRGRSFDPAKTENWPASPAAIEQRARQLQMGTQLTLAN